MIARELLPLCTSLCGNVSLTTPAVSGALLAANSLVERWVFGFYVSNLTGALNIAYQLETLSGVPIYRVASCASFGFGLYIFGPRRLNDTDNGLRIQSFGGATGAQDVHFTVILSNDALKICADKLSAEQFYVIP